MVAATEVADRGEASGQSTGTGARAKGLWNGEGEGEGGTSNVHEDVISPLGRNIEGGGSPR